MVGAFRLERDFVFLSGGTVNPFVVKSWVWLFSSFLQSFCEPFYSEASCKEQRQNSGVMQLPLTFTTAH